MKDLSKIDKNFAVERIKDTSNVRFYSATEVPFTLSGVFYEDGKFRRLPEGVAKSVSDGVYALHANTAGGRVRFCTDATKIILKAKLNNIGRMSHFTLCGSGGFDLYLDGEYHSTFMPLYEMTGGYESEAVLEGKKWREITIHFPLYSDVEEVYIGLPQTSKIKAAKPYKVGKPIVYYGSSITQGGCASRPGNAYPNILSRELKIDHVNLGFSGSAKAEKEIENYIKGLAMSVFVYDYDHNAPTIAHLKDTHARMFEGVREARPDLPIVILSRPLYRQDSEAKEREKIIQATYEAARKKGDENVYFISGKDLMKSAKADGTIDGCHPNDLGFYSMAKALKKILKKIIKEGENK